MASSEPIDAGGAAADRDSVMERRSFLRRVWAGAAGLVAGAGAWTTWDLLRPLSAGGFGGVIRAVRAEQIPDEGVIEVPAARAFLTKVGDDIYAISEKCTHLGCRVPYCNSSGRFECPCHGSYFSRGGDYLAGPAPRGMDQHPVEVIEGVVHIDTGSTIDGASTSGPKLVDEPPRGPACAEESH